MRNCFNLRNSQCVCYFSCLLGEFDAQELCGHLLKAQGHPLTCLRGHNQFGTSFRNNADRTSSIQ